MREVQIDAGHLKANQNLSPKSHFLLVTKPSPKQSRGRGISKALQTTIPIVSEWRQLRQTNSGSGRELETERKIYGTERKAKRLHRSAERSPLGCTVPSFLKPTLFGLQHKTGTHSWRLLQRLFKC